MYLWLGVISQVKWVKRSQQHSGAHGTPAHQPSTADHHPTTLPTACWCSPIPPSHPRSPSERWQHGLLDWQTWNSSILLRDFCWEFIELRFPPVIISPPTSHFGQSNEYLKHPPQKGRKTRHFVYTISFMHLASAVPQLENLPQLLVHFEQNSVGLLMNSSAQNTLGGFSLNFNLE